MQRRDGVRAIERAMVQIARNLGRRDLGRQVERRLGSSVDSSHVVVIDAIDEGSEKGAAPTIKDIARYLDVHHSRASRMVKSAIRAGLAIRLASQTDARSSCLELTDRGREIATAIHAARTKYFAIRMRGWSSTDRHGFARLLTLFAQTDEIRRGEPGGDDIATPGPPASDEDILPAIRPAPDKPLKLRAKSPTRRQKTTTRK